MVLPKNNDFVFLIDDEIKHAKTNKFSDKPALCE